MIVIDLQIDCIGNWGAWSACDGVSTQRSRTFTITTNLQNGGNACIAANAAIGYDYTCVVCLLLER